MGEQKISLRNNIVLRDTGEVVAYDFELKGAVKRVKKENALHAFTPSVLDNATITENGVETAFDQLVGTVVISDVSELDRHNAHPLFGNFIVGDALSEIARTSTKFRPRDAYFQMLKWNPNFEFTGRIGVVYGLRNTGKTTILLQLADKYIQEGVAVAYATYKYQECEINKVIADVMRLVRFGHKVILIDEITYTTSMLNSIMALSDTVPAKIIISGTDSLLLHWAMGDALYHRAVVAQTTNMRYSEYRRLFPDKDVMDFIENGGVIWNERPQTVDEYLLTSVVENIKHSIDMLDDCQHYSDRDFFEGMPSNELHNLLLAVCECAAYESVVKNVSKNRGKAVAWKLSLAHERLGGKKSDTGLQKIMDGLNDYYVRLPVEDFDVKTAEILLKRLRALNFVAEVKEMRETGVWRDTLVLVQPYVKRDFIRRTLSVVNMNEITEMRDTVSKMESIAAGIILEDIVYFEAIHRYITSHKANGDGDYVFKYRVAEKEIDIVVFKRGTKNHDSEMLLFEVKLSRIKVKTSSSDHGQDRFLIDKQFVGELQRYFEPSRLLKVVLYLGETDAEPDENGVRWVNAEEWLLGDK